MYHESLLSGHHRFAGAPSGLQLHFVFTDAEWLRVRPAAATTTCDNKNSKFEPASQSTTEFKLTRSKQQVDDGGERRWEIVREKDDLGYGDAVRMYVLSDREFADETIATSEQSHCSQCNARTTRQAEKQLDDVSSLQSVIRQIRFKRRLKHHHRLRHRQFRFGNTLIVRWRGRRSLIAERTSMGLRAAEAPCRKPQLKRAADDEDRAPATSKRQHRVRFAHQLPVHMRNHLYLDDFQDYLRRVGANQRLKSSSRLSRADGADELCDVTGTNSDVDNEKKAFDTNNASTNDNSSSCLNNTTRNAALCLETCPIRSQDSDACNWRAKLADELLRAWTRRQSGGEEIRLRVDAQDASEEAHGLESIDEVVCNNDKSPQSAECLYVFVELNSSDQSDRQRSWQRKRSNANTERHDDSGPSVDRLPTTHSARGNDDSDKRQQTDSKPADNGAREQSQFERVGPDDYDEFYDAFNYDTLSDDNVDRDDDDEPAVGRNERNDNDDDESSDKLELSGATLSTAPARASRLSLSSKTNTNTNKRSDCESSTRHARAQTRVKCASCASCWLKQRISSCSQRTRKSLLMASLRGGDSADIKLAAVIVINPFERSIHIKPDLNRLVCVAFDNSTHGQCATSSSSSSLGIANREYSNMTRHSMSDNSDRAQLQRLSGSRTAIPRVLLYEIRCFDDDDDDSNKQRDERRPSSNSSRSQCNGIDRIVAHRALSFARARLGRRNRRTAHARASVADFLRPVGGRVLLCVQLDIKHASGFSDLVAATSAECDRGNLYIKYSIGIMQRKRRRWHTRLVHNVSSAAAADTFTRDALAAAKSNRSADDDDDDDEDLLDWLLEGSTVTSEPNACGHFHFGCTEQLVIELTATAARCAQSTIRNHKARSVVDDDDDDVIADPQLDARAHREGSRAAVAVALQRGDKNVPQEDVSRVCRRRVEFVGVASDEAAVDGRTNENSLDHDEITETQKIDLAKDTQLQTSSLNNSGVANNNNKNTAEGLRAHNNAHGLANNSEYDADDEAASVAELFVVFELYTSDFYRDKLQGWTHTVLPIHVSHLKQHAVPPAHRKQRSSAPIAAGRTRQELLVVGPALTSLKDRLRFKLLGELPGVFTRTSVAKVSSTHV